MSQISLNHPLRFHQQNMKRKRPPQADEQIETKLEKKLHHDRKEIRKAARKAKTFEMQRILKKMKDARQKGDDDIVKNIEAQHMALKSLDCDLIADSALSTKIKKDKLLSQDPSLRSVMLKSLSASVIAPTAPNSAEGTVQSRLLSSKVLAADVARIIKGLRRLLNPEERICDAEDVPESPNVSQPPKKKSKICEKEGLDRVQHLLDAPSDGDPDEDIEGDGWESGTVSDAGYPVQGDLRLVSMSNEGSDDDEVCPTHEGGDVDPNVSHGRPGPNIMQKSKVTTAQSTFLPSLSVGFVRGDSDTDFSDSEAKAADGVKKNRRGQRARRAIWEKKFGRHANHVMKQKDTSKASNSFRPHDGTLIRNDQRQFGRGRNNSDSAPVTDRNTRIPSKSRFSASHMSGVRKEEKSLHPSWEAKRRLQKVAIVPAQGTRIVFD